MSALGVAAEAGGGAVALKPARFAVRLAVVGSSGCLAVLVDESAAGGVSSDRLAGPVRDDFARVGRALTEAAVRSVRVVVLDVLVEELFEVSVVTDEGPVAEFAACGTDPSFRIC